MAQPVGRPREIDREALKIAFERYIEETPIPIVAEFAASQGLSKQYVHQCEELLDLIKICLSKKESALERQSLDGDVNVTMAIFSLKQLGWSDRQETTHKGDVTIVTSEADSKL